MPRLRVVLAVVVAAVALLPASAVAQGPPADVPVDPGVSESSSIVLCGTNPFGGPGIVVEGAKAFVLLPVLPQPPKVGEVFYAIALISAVGDSCVGQLAHVEVIPPLGVELAVSAQAPIICEYGNGTTTRPVATSEGCPRATPGGLFGAAVSRTTRADGLWELPLGESLALKIPLRASRTLAGLAGGTPSCGRQQGAFPCRAEQAGDSLQVAVQVLDGQTSPWLVPYNALTVAAGAGPTRPSTGGDGIRLRAPASLRIARAVRGVPITVAVPADGSTVRAELRARLRRLPRGLLARATVRRADAGELRMRLRPSRAGRRALGRASRVKATLKVSVTPRGGDRQVATTRIVLGR